MTAPAPSSAARRVLVAEDDRAVRESITRGLRYEGYDVTAVGDGAEALQAAAEDRPDVAVLDVMMPNLDGLSACRTLRSRHPDLPILLLTARHEVRDRVAGLDAGADDYLVKPYAMAELTARLRALLRRTSVTGADRRLVVGDLELDPAARLAWRAGALLDLTKTEFDLLELLLFNAGIVLSRDQIYAQIWGYDFETTSRSLDVYIGYLRQKTEQGGAERIVHTVRGIGYVARTP
jgi:two-component system response regulator MprA